VKFAIYCINKTCKSFSREAEVAVICLGFTVVLYSLVGCLSVIIKMFRDAQHVNSRHCRAADIDAFG